MKNYISFLVILIAAVSLTTLGGCSGSGGSSAPASSNVFSGVEVDTVSQTAGTAVAKIALSALGYSANASLSSAKATVPVSSSGQCAEGGTFESDGFSIESAETDPAEYFRITTIKTTLTGCIEDGYTMSGVFYVTAMSYPKAGGGETIDEGLRVTILADPAATIVDDGGHTSYPAYIVLDAVAQENSIVSSDVTSSRILVESYVSCVENEGALSCQLEDDGAQRICPTQRACSTDADCANADAPRGAAFDSLYGEIVFNCLDGCCVPGQVSDNLCAGADEARFPACVDDMNNENASCPFGTFCDYSGKCLPLCLTDADCPVGSCFNFLNAMTVSIDSWPVDPLIMNQRFGIDIPADVGICQCISFEHCDDNIDNDGDGLIDCDDPDCAANSAECRCSETGMSCTLAQVEYPSADADTACSNDGAAAGEAWRECDEASDCCVRVDCAGNCTDPRCAEHPACGNCPLKLGGETFSCEYATATYGDCTIGGNRDWHCVEYCCRDDVCGDSWSCAEAAEVGGCEAISDSFFTGISSIGEFFSDNLVCATDIDPGAAPCCVPAALTDELTCPVNIPNDKLTCGTADELYGGCNFPDEPEIGDYLTCFDYGLDPAHVGCCVDKQCGFDHSCDFALDVYELWHMPLPGATIYPEGPVRDDRACDYTHFPEPAACDQTSRCCVSVTEEYIDAVLSPYQ